jgi:hypothetical protein
MSESFVNQITLDCLLNKEMYSKHLKSKKNKQINKEERKFYRKRIYNLFKEIISGKPPKDLAPDVKYSYDNFINSAIQYFKTVDNNDIIQSEYNGCDFSLEDSSAKLCDFSANVIKKNQADLLLTRSVKIEVPTLDKYVTRTRIKKEEEIILPRQKEINLQDPELKNKGLKKNNINNMYEDKNTKNKNDENKNVKGIFDKNNEK